MATLKPPAPGDIVVRAVKADSDVQYKVTRRIDSSQTWEHLAFVGRQAPALRFACDEARGNRVFFYPNAESDEYQMHECGRADD